MVKDQTHDDKCTSELWFVDTCWMLKHVETFTGHQTDSSSPEAVLWHRWLKAAPQRALHCGSITTQRTQQINWSNMRQTLVLCRCFIIFFVHGKNMMFHQPKHMMLHQPKNIRLALKCWPGCTKKRVAFDGQNGFWGCWNCSFHPTLKLRTRKGQSSLPLGGRGIFPGSKRSKEIGWIFADKWYLRGSMWSEKKCVVFDECQQSRNRPHCKAHLQH